MTLVVDPGWKGSRMKTASLFRTCESRIPAANFWRQGFFRYGGFSLPALACWAGLCLLVTGGCVPPAPEDCLVAGQLGFVAQSDSLGLGEFLTLSSEEQEQRREQARQWRQRAEGAGRMDHRLQSLATAGGLAPDDPEIWLRLAANWRWVGDHLATVTYLGNAAAAVRNLIPDPVEDEGDLQNLQNKKIVLARRIAVLRAWLHFDRGEFSKGKTWIEAAARAGPYEPDVLLIKGLTLARLGERSHALAVADEIYRRYPYDKDINWIRGSVELTLGQLDEALVYYTRFRPDREHAAECYRDKAAMAERLRQWSYARRWYEKSKGALPIADRTCLRKITGSVLDPECSGHELPVWLAFGRNYVTGSLSAYCAFAWDRFEMAATPQESDIWAGAVVDAAGILIRQDIDEVWALRLRGLVFASKEMTDRALWDLRLADRKLQKLDRQDALVLAEMGRMHLLEERYERALPHLRRAVEIDAGSARAWSDLGLALIMTGQSESAELALSRALQLDDSLATSWYNRGLLNLHANRLIAAAADLQEAARLAPDNLEISALLQRIYQLQQAGKARPGP